MKPILSLRLALCGAVALLNHTALGAGKPVKDTTPPAAVANLTVTGVTPDSITLTWTATANDGNNPASGSAKQYDVRHAYAPITDQNWASAWPAFGVPVPQPAGSLESYTLSFCLLPETTYYIRLKVADEVPNLSPLSNEAIGTTGAGTWSRDIVELLEQPLVPPGYPSLPGLHMNDLEFDPRDGHPSIAFSSGYKLKLAHWNGSTWTSEVIDSLGAASSSYGIDLVFEPGTGFPTLSYRPGNQVIKFAHWNGASWVLETVDGNTAAEEHTALAYDADGHPSIAYHRTTGNGNRAVVSLMFAVKVGAVWSPQTVVAGVRADYKAMAYDPYGNPTIAYRDTVRTSSGAALYNTVNFARKSGSNWTIEVVDSNLSPGNSFGMGLDMEYDPLTGQPAISHYGGPNCDQASVCLSRWNGSQWNTEVIEGTDGACIGGTSLEFDAGGVPRVAFGNDNQARIKLARWNGLAWEIEILGCSSQFEVCRGSLEIDSLGRPAFAHRVGTELRYSIRNAP